MTLATPQAAPASPVYAALFSGTAMKATNVNEPESIPPPPTPASARPTMNVVLSRATPKPDNQPVLIPPGLFEPKAKRNFPSEHIPQIKLPTSKITIEAR